MNTTTVNIDTFSIRGIKSGWTFTNMYYDAKKQIYHCRIRQNRTDEKIVERTGSGATMLIAVWNANRATEQSESVLY